MRLELLVGLRYMGAKNREGALSLITTLAVLGVALGVAAMVIALSLMNGYRVNVVRVMAGAMPHISLSSQSLLGFRDVQAVKEAVTQAVGAQSVSPYALRDVLISNPLALGAPVQGMALRGLDPEREQLSPEFLSLLHDGQAGFERLPAQERQVRAARVLATLTVTKEDKVYPVLISRMLAKKLGVQVGQTLTPLKFPKKGEQFMPAPMPIRLRVAGYFETGIVAFDEMVLLMNLGHMALAFNMLPGEFSLGVRIAEPLRAGEAAHILRDLEMGQGNSFSVYSWLDANKGLFAMIQTQKTLLGLVLMLIVVIAFFGMASALVMLVLDKTREIATLKALGATQRQVRLAFMWQGVLIGLAGLALGMMLGLGLCWVLDTFPLIEIPPGVYPGSNKVPVRVEIHDLLMVAAATLAVSLGATLYPASRAMGLSPVQGLRWE